MSSTNLLYAQSSSEICIYAHRPLGRAQSQSQNPSPLDLRAAACADADATGDRLALIAMARVALAQSETCSAIALARPSIRAGRSACHSQRRSGRENDRRSTSATSCQQFEPQPPQTKPSNMPSQSGNRAHRLREHEYRSLHCPVR